MRLQVRKPKMMKIIAHREKPVKKRLTVKELKTKVCYLLVMMSNSIIFCSTCILGHFVLSPKLSTDFLLNCIELCIVDHSIKKRNWLHVHHFQGYYFKLWNSKADKILFMTRKY